MAACSLNREDKDASMLLSLICLYAMRTHSLSVIHLRVADKHPDASPSMCMSPVNLWDSKEIKRIYRQDRFVLPRKFEQRLEKGSIKLENGKWFYFNKNRTWCCHGKFEMKNESILFRLY